MRFTRDELFAAYALDDRTRPRVRMNFVASADGAVTLNGHSGSLGGQSDRDAMEVLRALADVILVGAGTVRVEGYGGLVPQERDAAWRRAHGLSAQPRLAVVSGRLDLRPDAPVFTEASTRPLVITHAEAPADRRRALAEVADIVDCGQDAVDLSVMKRELATRGLPQVLCEGGPHLFGSLLDAGQVDELCLTLAPRLVGGAAGRIVQGASEADRGFDLHGVLRDDEGYVLLRYVR
ncbi:pyrimidine reductase family protein [Microbacterium kribbense]|uniref:Pyrimidine reductase family protein n=1 Tax=Microbacterium kribbense TaxID=433645 RepID=A0ABP7GAE3_9MICO